MLTMITLSTRKKFVNADIEALPRDGKCRHALKLYVCFVFDMVSHMLPRFPYVAVSTLGVGYCCHLVFSLNIFKVFSFFIEYFRSGL